jgi:hypothetical protein
MPAERGRSLPPGPLLKTHIPLTKQALKALPANIGEHIRRAAEAIKLRQAPDYVLISVRGATTDAGSRRIVIRFLVGDDMVSLFPS